MLDQTDTALQAHPRRTLSGRTALVTGSSSGIGLGIAKALAAAGAKVMLHGIEPAEVMTEAARRLVAETGTEVGYLPADVGNPTAVADLLEGTEAQMGVIDILVNNAGIQHVAPLETFPPAKWDAILAINLSAVFHATRGVLAGMKARGFGRIINMSSAHGLIASPFKAAYVAAKHAVIGLTKVTALEGAEQNVTCNAICPGYVWTPLVEKQIEGQAQAHGITREAVIRDVFLKEQPTRRFATIEEIGALAAFLASDAAASITGTALPVDGGWTAH